MEDAPGAKELTDVKGQIDLDDVTFRYDAAGPAVLSHVSLHVAPGETVAVVGPSGGGKSTLCQLIPRFYDVSGGAVRIDGQDVRTLCQSSLRRNIGIVQQDVFLFAGTIYENIAYGRPGATREEIEEAAGRRRSTTIFSPCPTGLTPMWASGASCSPAGRNSASPLPASF